MMRKAIILGIAGFFSLIRFSSADIDPQAGSLIKEYTQQSVYNSLLQTTSDIIGTAISQQKLNVLPPVAFQAIQQAVLQCFEQESTREIIRSAYDEVTELGVNLFEEGTSQEQVQSSIRAAVDRQLHPIVEEPVYRNIVEEVIKLSVSETHRIMVMQVAQRRAQIAAIQQQQQVLQRAILEQYQKAIQQQIAEHITQQLDQQYKKMQSAYQQQIDQLQAQDAFYRQQLQGQYQQQLQQQQTQRSYPSGVY